MFSKKISPVLIALLYLISGHSCGWAQVTFNGKENVPRNYLIKVKQLNEFIDRFNFQKDFLNHDIGPSFSGKITRQEYIGLLFNQSGSPPEHKIPENTRIDSALARSFIQEVCRDSLFIDKYSELIYAELKCRVTINEKSNYLSILVKQEIDHGLKWSIVSVHSDDIPGQGRQGEDKKYVSPGVEKEQLEYIPPLSNETNFIVLKKVLINKSNLDIYTAIDHNPERINIFYNLLGTGELKFKYVESIAYYIFDIHSWLMIVRNYQRDTENSGWLISGIERINGDSYDYFREKFGMDHYPGSTP